jgi:hypothetical protein
MLIFRLSYFFVFNIAAKQESHSSAAYCCYLVPTANAADVFVSFPLEVMTNREVNDTLLTV